VVTPASTVLISRKDGIVPVLVRKRMAGMKKTLGVTASFSESTLLIVPPAHTALTSVNLLGEKGGIQSKYRSIQIFDADVDS